MHTVITDSHKICPINKHLYILKEKEKETNKPKKSTFLLFFSRKCKFMIAGAPSLAFRLAIPYALEKLETLLSEGMDMHTSDGLQGKECTQLGITHTLVTKVLKKTFPSC